MGVAQLTLAQWLIFIRRHFGFGRMAFLLHYLLARLGARSVNELLPVIEKSFDHPWVSSVELNIRFYAGRETERNRLSRLLKPPRKNDEMFWDGPITVSIFTNRSGKEQQALCMSLYIRSGVVYIFQLQGLA
jgi:hypothetical protein